MKRLFPNTDRELRRLVWSVRDLMALKLVLWASRISPRIIGELAAGVFEQMDDGRLTDKGREAER